MTFFPRHVSKGCGCDDPSVSSGLISIDAAMQLISNHVSVIKRTQTVPLHHCRDRVLAAPVNAQDDMPRFDHAAMDGYALCSAALTRDGPWRLPVSGRVAAGDAPDTSCPSTAACRIFTGAPVPLQFDTVVMQEKVELVEDAILLHKSPNPGENIRKKGEEYKRGCEILPSGTVLTPRAIAACAAAGKGTVDIRDHIRVTALASGSEVAAPGTEVLRGGQIWDVNTPMLQSLLARSDVELVDVLRVEDDVESIRSALCAAGSTSDLIVTTGGISVGDEDHLHAALQAAGGEIIFHGVAIKPGKPVTLGRIGEAIWLGLPGNPGSAFVTWSLFGETVLNTLAGRQASAPKRRHVVLGQGLTRKAGRCEIRAARIVGTDGCGRDVIDCGSGGNSGRVCHYADADGLAFLPSEMDQVPEGSLIEFLPLCTN